MLSFLKGLALVTVPVVGGFLVWTLYPLRADLQHADLSPLIAKAGVALDTINHGCAPGPCGTLANVDKAVVKLGDIAVTSQKQVQQSGVLITAAADNINSVGSHVSGVVDSLKETANAATGTLKAGQTDLETANQTIAALQTLVGHADKSVEDFDALLDSPDVTRFLKSSADTSQQFSLIATQGAFIAGDIHREADLITAPKPWWKKLGDYSTTGVNVACLVTHSCPF